MGTPRTALDGSFEQRWPEAGQERAQVALLAGVELRTTLLLPLAARTLPQGLQPSHSTAYVA